MTLRLDQHADSIAELSTNASKELAIETSLQAIAGTWVQLPLDLAEYKGTFKLRSTEDVSTLTTHPAVYPYNACWMEGRRIYNNNNNNNMDAAAVPP